MATELTVNELKQIRQEISETYKFAMDTVADEFAQGNININQFNDATGELLNLKRESLKLLGLIMDMQLGQLLDTDVDSPASKIIAATEKLKQAAQQIGSFLDLLKSIEQVVSITAKLIISLQTGSIATILGLL